MQSDLQCTSFTACNAQSRSLHIHLPHNRPTQTSSQQSVVCGMQMRPEAVATRSRPAPKYLTTHARIGHPEHTSVLPFIMHTRQRRCSEQSGTAIRRWGAPLRRWGQVQAQPVRGGRSPVGGCLRGRQPVLSKVLSISLDANSS